MGIFMLKPHEYHHEQAGVAFSSHLQPLHKYLGAIENHQDLLCQIFKKQARKPLELPVKAKFMGIYVVQSRLRCQRASFQIDVWAGLLFLRITLLAKF